MTYNPEYYKRNKAKFREYEKRYKNKPKSLARIKKRNHERYELYKDEYIETSRQNYQNNKKDIDEANKSRRVLAKTRIDKIAIEYGCRNPDCKWLGCFHPSQLEFHHFDPSTKKFSVRALRGYILKTIATEINKCIVLCGCCHPLVHAGVLVLDESLLCNVNNELEIIK